jgi:probable RNA-binding protein EIF1AD
MTEVPPVPRFCECPSKFPKSHLHPKYLFPQQSTPLTFSHSSTTAKMPKPRRNLQATAEETMTPPPSLTSTQSIARVLQAAGNNLYRVELPEDSTKALLLDSKALLVELPARFRSTIWIKRGGFVLIDVDAMKERENKLDGEIVNVVRNEKEWRKQSYW